MGKPISGKVKEYKSEDGSDGESHECQPGPQKPIRLVRLGKWGMGQVGGRLGMCLKLGEYGCQSGGEHTPGASLLNKAGQTITIWVIA